MLRLRELFLNSYLFAIRHSIRQQPYWLPYYRLSLLKNLAFNTAVAVLVAVLSFQKASKFEQKSGSARMNAGILCEKASKYEQNSGSARTNARFLWEKASKYEQKSGCARILHDYLRSNDRNSSCNLAVPDFCTIFERGFLYFDVRGSI